MVKTGQEMRIEIRERMRGAPGQVSIQHIFEKEEFTGKCRLFARLTLEPGSGIGLHEHQAEEEVFYILKGTGTCVDDGKAFDVKMGDAILTGNGKGHSITNTGQEVMEMLAVILLFA